MMMSEEKSAFFELEDSCISDLEKCFQKGPLIEYQGKELYFFNEEQVACIEGLKIFIFSNEHPPPHFHIKYNGEENSFSLVDGAPLYPQNGLKKYFRNIARWYSKNRSTLVAAWNRTRPSNCPVGPIE